MSEPRPQSPPDPQVELVRTFEIVISTLLRVGVIVSLFVILAGLALSLIHHPKYLHSRDALKEILSPQRPAWHTLKGLASGLREFRGEAIIMLGLLLLIATPVLRVAVSIVAFFFERDWTFVAITAFVLAMLILSFVLGKAGG
jgi:uncharacterized membrane protein